MKKLLTILTLISIILITEVHAECDAKTKLEINTAASNVTAELYYEYKTVGVDGNVHPEIPDEVIKDLESGYARSMFVDIKVNNVSENIYFTISNEDENLNEIVYSNNLINGEYIHQVPDTAIIRNYTIKIYSNINDCSDEEIRTIEIKAPMYNELSGTRVCQNNDAYYCLEFITTPIDLDEWELLKKLNSGIETEEPENLNNTNQNQHIILYAIIGLVIILILVIIIKIIKRKKEEKDIMRQSL